MNDLDQWDESDVSRVPVEGVTLKLDYDALANIVEQGDRVALFEEMLDTVDVSAAYSAIFKWYLGVRLDTESVEAVKGVCEFLQALSVMK